MAQVLTALLASRNSRTSFGLVSLGTEGISNAPTGLQGHRGVLPLRSGAAQRHGINRSRFGILFSVSHSRRRLRFDCNFRVEHGHAQPVGALAAILFIEPIAAARKSGIS